MILCPESLSTPICLQFVSEGVFFSYSAHPAQFEILTVHHIGGANATRLKPYISKTKGGESCIWRPNTGPSSTKQAGCRVRHIVNVWAQGLMTN